MTSQPGEHIGIAMLPNISKSKSNQTIKFGQLIEYNTRNIFLEKYTQNMWRNYSQTFFLKIKIEHISAAIA